MLAKIHNLFYNSDDMHWYVHSFDHWPSYDLAVTLTKWDPPWISSKYPNKDEQHDSWASTKMPTEVKTGPGIRQTTF